MPRHLTAHLLLAVLVIMPMAAATAQEVESDERPDTGYRLLGPRTVISFVRQTLPDTGDGTSDFPRWNTVVHVSNVGNGPLVAAAIFVASNGGHRSARLRVPPTIRPHRHRRPAHRSADGYVRSDQGRFRAGFRPAPMPYG